MGPQVVTRAPDLFLAGRAIHELRFAALGGVPGRPHDHGFTAFGGPSSGDSTTCLPHPGFTEDEYRTHGGERNGRNGFVHSGRFEMNDLEPAMQQEGEHSRASPTFGSGMPHSIEDLPRPPSPPPSGTTFDLDLERAPTMPSFPLQNSEEPIAVTQSSHASDTDRTRRQAIQLTHWRMLLKKQPQDELAFFWREQCQKLEALLQAHQRAGSKRQAESFDLARKCARS